MRHLCSRLLLSLLIASSASAVTMDWTPIGNPGNACDPQTHIVTGAPLCFGAVAYAYDIGTYDVTNAQYAEFLNAKAAADPLGLYHTSMANHLSGITRTGSSGSYSYSVIAGREEMPVNYVSFYDALRFANWMNNGQGSASTEIGAYTLLGPSNQYGEPSNGTTVMRNAGAAIVLPSENEWYKAAYYDATSISYFDYPAGSDTQTNCAAPTAAANSANCGGVVGNLTIKGSYTGSASPYGTFDQGGNVWEWNDDIFDGYNCFAPSPQFSCRGFRGGSLSSGSSSLAASTRSGFDPAYAEFYNGFRLAMIPEPGTGLLVMAGLLGLAARRRGPPAPGHQPTVDGVDQGRVAS